MEEAIQKFPKIRHRHFLTWSLAILLLGFGAFAWWSFKHAEERIAELQEQMGTLEKENKEFSARPVQERPPSALSMAVGKVPLCGAWTADPGYKVPSAGVLVDLALGDVMAEGYVIMEICADTGEDRVAFIAAKDGAAESDVFGTVTLTSGTLTIKRSILKLGLPAELPNICRIDGVAPGGTAAEDRLLMYCGPKGGSLTAWYAYDVKDDKLILTQEYTGAENNEYTVREGAILEQFHIRRRP